MSTIDLAQKDALSTIINQLTVLAKKELIADDEEIGDVMDVLCCHNQEDIYFIAEAEGKIQLARSILDSLGIEY